MQGRKPLIVIFSLIVILVFIVGIRQGQRVERSNKINETLLSIPPTKPVPTEAPNEFKVISHKGCRVEFLAPKDLKLKESSTEAMLSKDNHTEIAVDCKRLVPSPTIHPKVATESVSFQGKKVIARIKNGTGFKLYGFPVIHPITRQEVRLTIEKNLIPLLDRTLKFQ